MKIFQWVPCRTCTDGRARSNQASPELRLQDFLHTLLSSLDCDLQSSLGPEVRCLSIAIAPARSPSWTRSPAPFLNFFHLNEGSFFCIGTFTHCGYVGTWVKAWSGFLFRTAPQQASLVIKPSTARLRAGKYCDRPFQPASSRTRRIVL